MVHILIPFLLNWAVESSFDESIRHPKSPSDIPNPISNPSACGRPGLPHSKICDVDNLMSSEHKNVIEGYLNGLNVEGAVVIVKKMSPEYIRLSSDKQKASENFAQSLHDTWGVGDRSKQNGILMFVSVDDRVLYISTGKGVEDKLPSRVLNLIIEGMKPSLKEQRYGRAIERGIIEIDLILKGKSNISEDLSQQEMFWSISIILGFLSFIFFVYRRNAAERTTMQRLNKGRDALNRLVSECSTGEKFYSRSCPICLEDFPKKNRQTDDMIDSSEQSKLINDDITEKSVAATDGYQTPEEHGRRPMALPCGHIFCFSCVTQFLKQQPLQNRHCCPVCRAPLDGSRPPEQRPDSPPSRPPDVDERYPSCQGIPTTANVPTEPLEYFGHRRPDLLFRLDRIHQLYPEVLPVHTHAQMQDVVQRGSLRELEVAARVRTVEVNRVLNDIAMRREAATRGSSGSSSGSWGGGSSSGGSGGSW